jgi:hypothetical protein
MISGRHYSEATSPGDRFSDFNPCSIEREEGKRMDWIKREALITEAAEEFLRRKGRPHVTIQRVGDDEYELKNATRPQLERNPPYKVVFINLGEADYTNGFFAGAESLGEGEMLEKKNEGNIHGKIVFSDPRSRPHEGIVCVRNDDDETYYKHLRINLKTGLYSLITKDPRGFDVAEGPDVRPKAAPKKRIEKNRTFSSVDDLRSALQKGEFVR